MTENAQLLQIQTDKIDGHVVVKLTGEADLASAPVLKETLLILLHREDDPLVVDLAEVDFIDSTALAALIAGHRRARQLDRDYRLAGPTRHVAKVLKLTGIDTLIPIHRSLTDACSK